MMCVLDDFACRPSRIRVPENRGEGRLTLERAKDGLSKMPMTSLGAIITNEVTTSPRV